MRRASALLAGLGAALVVCLAPSSASALVPYDRVLFVSAALSDAPWARDAAHLVGAYATTRLGYRPEKVFVPDDSMTLDELTRLLRDRGAQKALQQDDLVVVYLAGVPARGGEKAVARFVKGLPGVLRRKGTKAPGLFHGNALVLADQVLAKAPGGLDNVSALVLAPPGKRGRASLVTGEALRGAGGDKKRWRTTAQALSVCGEPCEALVDKAGGLSSGAAALLAGAEQLASAPAGDAPDLLALRAAIAKSTGDKAKRFPLSKAASYRPNDYRLLTRELVIKLESLIPTPDSRKALALIKRRLSNKASPETRAALRVLGGDEEPDGHFVLCDVLADDAFASIHCEDQRQRRVFDAKDVDASVLPGTIEELSDHLLNRYGALTVHHTATLQAGRKPAFVVFLADNSTSMAYNDPTTVSDPEATNVESKRETAAFRLIESLATQAERLGKATRFALITFANEAGVVALGGKDHLVLKKAPTGKKEKALRKTIHEAIGYHGGTNLLAPLEQARELVQTHGANHECHVILLTDGRDTSSEERAKRRTRILKEAQALKSLGASVHTVGLTEARGKLDDYLRRLRAGGDTYEVYTGLHGSRKRNGKYHAKMIRKVGFHDPAVLDKLRLGDGRVKAGAFVQPGSTELFQKQFEEVVTLITGGGVYSSRKAVRQRDPFDTKTVVDNWQFDIDLRTGAQIVLYNPEGLEVDPRRGWTITRDGSSVKIGGRHVKVRPVGRTVTELILSAPAKGQWRIRRTGRLP